ncbi:MAG: hypothetical protein ABIV43_02225 [Candidatus Saccharimonadales bacterium]
MELYNRHAKAKLATTVIAIFVIAGTVLLADHFDISFKSGALTSSIPKVAASSVTAQPSTSNVSPTASPAIVSPPVNDSGYKDGTYTAQGFYYVPDGYENISVTLSISDGVIKQSSVTNSQGDNASAQYQADFTDNYKSYVVGRSIKGLKLNRVAGASDTSQGFNDAVAKIVMEAQA